MLQQIIKEFNKKYSAGFLWLVTIGCIMQLVAFIITKCSYISFISGTAGVLSVVLCSEKKISMYIFGFIQLLTYVYLCLQQNLYGEIFENIFYFVTMIIGVILWQRNYNEEKCEVVIRRLNFMDMLFIGLNITILSLPLGGILSNTNDTYPYLDAFSTIPAFAAQILMILRYREQWWCWIIVDILTCILWIKLGNWCMVAQYVFWTANCIYGLKNWKN